MAKGLVGGVNSTTTRVASSCNTSTSGVTVQTESNPEMSATIGELSTYSARISNMPPAPVEYVGRETDSMYINVDNDLRTISGEVKWRNMIATNESEEDAYHAYPANKARINFSEIEKSVTTLQDDVASLEQSCNTSVDTISKYVEELEAIETSLNECKKFCTHLRQSLDQEIAARELDHVNLRRTAAENFNTLKEDVSRVTTDTVERLNVQEELIQSTRSSLTSETSRAKSEESRIEKSLYATNKVVSENKQGIASLREDTVELVGRVQALENSDVVDKTNDHAEAIQELRQKIADTDFRLSGQYTTTAKETVKLRDIQYKHESLITSLTADVKETEKHVEDLQQDVSTLQSDVTGLQTSVTELADAKDTLHSHILNGLRSEATIRRETDTFHEEELRRLEVRISTLQQELTQVIQALANELRNRDAELYESLTNISYDFVDAGNAPV